VSTNIVFIKKMANINIKKIAIIISIFIGISTGLFFYLTKDSFSVPVLMYHYVSDKESPDAIAVSKQDFRKQMKYLKDNGYKFLTLDELEDFKNNKKKFPRKSVVITFDDGYSNVYTNAFPIMKEYGAKGTIFVISNKIDVAGYLSSKQMQEMQKSGYIKIGSHSENHPNMPELSYESQLMELKQSKSTIEQVIGDKVDYLAYPYGESNSDTEKAAKDCGYKLAFRVDSTNTRIEQNNYRLKRLWALSDFNRFTEICKVSRISDIRGYAKRILKRNTYLSEAF
jgi:peptidoglycan/xylan/chitin deacetylase (PgdA/CDA1 family)